MLSSFPVACPHANCGWTGNLVPSLLKGGADAEIASMHRAWFRCPSCQSDWEVRITNDRVTVLPVIDPGIVSGNGVSSNAGRAVAFDLDSASLASLHEALPGWEIDTINGANSDSLTGDWDPGAADLLIVNASESAAATLGLCRFLSFCSQYSTEARAVGTESRPDAPLLLLVPVGKEALVGAALKAGARSCLVLPVHAKQVTGMLARVRAGNQPGRHTLNLDHAQTEDRWRDDGGQG